MRPVFCLKSVEHCMTNRMSQKVYTLAVHRHDEILRQLKEEGRILVRSLADQLDVNDETIRRDLRLLEKAGQLRRVHGGAVLPRSQQDEPLMDRGRINMPQKTLIAMLADQQVQDGMSIFLDTGTTTLALARRLVGRRITVTTNSIDVALTLRHDDTEVRMPPGSLRLNDNALMGHATLDYVRRYIYDIAFMGVAACNATYGWTDYAEAETALRRTLRMQARRSILLVDSSKFGRQAYIKTFALDEIQHVIADKAPNGNLLEAFHANGVQLVTAQ